MGSGFILAALPRGELPAQGAQRLAVRRRRVQIGVEQIDPLPVALHEAILVPGGRQPERLNT